MTIHCFATTKPVSIGAYNYYKFGGLQTERSRVEQKSRTCARTDAMRNDGRQPARLCARMNDYGEGASCLEEERRGRKRITGCWCAVAPKPERDCGGDGRLGNVFGRDPAAEHVLQFFGDGQAQSILFGGGDHLRRMRRDDEKRMR